MKIYEKLCELKGCSTLTGRVIEHRIAYSSTRYPEINKRVGVSIRSAGQSYGEMFVCVSHTFIFIACGWVLFSSHQIERFINSPEAQKNPPDYQDILQQMLRTNERYNLCLSRKQLNQMAKEAFREVGTRIQDRRHLDLVYNFGSHLTDCYKPGKRWNPFFKGAQSSFLRTRTKLVAPGLSLVNSPYLHHATVCTIAGFITLIPLLLDQVPFNDYWFEMWAFVSELLHFCPHP